MSILYFWGKSISANSFTTSKCESILKINSDEEITEISCGHDHAFFKSATGYLYAFGNNSYGQLGIINRQTNNVDICRVMISTKKLVVAISCGWNHTLVLDQAGDVFSCGKGADGALGYGVGENSYSFGFVLKGARKISAGLDHSLAICGSKVMGWGNCT